MFYVPSTGSVSVCVTGALGVDFYISSNNKHSFGETKIIKLSQSSYGLLLER